MAVAICVSKLVQFSLRTRFALSINSVFQHLWPRVFVQWLPSCLIRARYEAILVSVANADMYEDRSSYQDASVTDQQVRWRVRDTRAHSLVFTWFQLSQVPTARSIISLILPSGRIQRISINTKPSSENNRKPKLSTNSLKASSTRVSHSDLNCSKSLKTE